MKKLILILCLFGCSHKVNIKRVIIKIGNTEMRMVWIPEGSFKMGSVDTMSNRDEQPVHSVFMDGFWMSESPVTNAQFSEFVNKTNYITTAEIVPKVDSLINQQSSNNLLLEEMIVTGSLIFKNHNVPANQSSPMKWWSWSANSNWKKPYGSGSSISGYDNHPVVQVSWYDAVAFSEWAMMELPTEAQWEYAAKKGETREFRDKNIWQGIFPVNNLILDGYEKTNPVYKFKPNRLGLYDMAGNVWEWVMDWYHPNAYSMKDRVRNPEGPLYSFDPMEPTISKRVTRGGSFLCSDQYCAGYRTSARMKTSPDTSLEHTGFRCVMSTDQMNLFLE